MLVEWLIDFALGLLVQLLAFVPFPDTLDLGALGPAFSVMLTFNAVLPMSEILAGAGVIGSLLAVMFILKIVQQGVAHIPWIGGSGG